MPAVTCNYPSRPKESSWHQTQVSPLSSFSNGGHGQKPSKPVILKEQFNFGGALDEYSSAKDFGQRVGAGRNIAAQTHLYGTEAWGDLGDLSSFWSELGIDNFYVDIVSPPFQSCDEGISELVSVQSEDSEVIEPKKEEPILSPSASLTILNNYGGGFRRLNAEKINAPSYDTTCTVVHGRKLSTNAIMRLAGEKFINSCSQLVDDISAPSHPYSSSFTDLSDEEAKDVELVQCLLASVEKISQQQFDRARKLLIQCDDSSSNKGNPVQRVVYYFSEALREKIDHETGGFTSQCLGKKQSRDTVEAVMSPNPTIISFYKNIPFIQVSQFSGVQALIDNLGGAKKVHIIDLEIRGGTHCTILMQALAARGECPLEHLKITAVGTRLKPKIEETGNRLMSFARSMNLSFSFNVVMVADMLDLNEYLFELDSEEVVAVYSSCILNSMIQRPDRLECLMRVMRNINPCVMVVTEIEASHNSPIFVNRFIETLFFYGAFFDALADGMRHDEPNRMMSESIYTSQAIRNIVAAEGEDRTLRHVNIHTWRMFLARFGMVEIDLSLSSLYQANMLLTNFACGSSCRLEIDGKSLMIGWKETPMFSLSVWKFL
ncbi:unnamed protein product [Ilex paraguariensis]|uniref:DELLA protein RGL1 n=1 Tax=Ilex paraguariensis TaxID=185542 RepID=A0ABC8R7J9_9AQUA